MEEKIIYHNWKNNYGISLYDNGKLIITNTEDVIIYENIINVNDTISNINVVYITNDKSLIELKYDLYSIILFDNEEILIKYNDLVFNAVGNVYYWEYNLHNQMNNVILIDIMRYELYRFKIEKYSVIFTSLYNSFLLCDYSNGFVYYYIIHYIIISIIIEIILILTLVVF